MALGPPACVKAIVLASPPACPPRSRLTPGSSVLLPVSLRLYPGTLLPSRLLTLKLPGTPGLLQTCRWLERALRDPLLPSSCF